MNDRFNCFLNSGQLPALKDLAEQTNQSASDWVRHMIEYCMRPEVMCNLMPLCCSGQIKIGR